MRTLALNITILLCCIVQFAYSSVLIDSTVKVNNIGVAIGYIQGKEMNLHPKVNGGFVAQVSYENIRTRKHLSDLGLEIGFARYKTKYEDVASSMNVQLRINYHYQLRVVNKKGIKYYIGPGAGIQYNFSYYPMWDDSHLYHANFWAIGFKNTITYILPKGMGLLFDLKLPLFSVISRPVLSRKYKMDDLSVAGVLTALHGNIQAAHLTNNAFVETHFQFSYPVSKKLGQAVFASLYFNRVKHNNGNPNMLLQYLIGFKLLLK